MQRCSQDKTSQGQSPQVPITFLPQLSAKLVTCGQGIRNTVT